MSSETKERILSTAIQLFNADGIMNIRLQNIADACQISVGNLAYHFKEHSSLVYAAINKTVKESAIDVKEWKALKGLIDFDNLIIRLHGKIIEHSFIYTDYLEIKRNFTVEFEKIKNHALSLETNLRDWLLRNSQEGLLQKEIPNETLEAVIEAVTNLIQLYPYQRQTKGEPFDEIMFRGNIWGLIEPVLSENGKIEYDILISPIFK